VLVHTPATVLADVVVDPAHYPRFMPAMNSVKIVAHQPGTIVYDWSFELAALHLSGRNAMTIYAAPRDRPDAGTRVTIDSQQGDLGRGRFLLRVVPHGPQQSLLVLSMRLDLRQANYVLRQLAKSAPSVNRSANLALAVSMALHLQHEAESRVLQPTPPSATATTFTRPHVDAKLLAPLLTRGDLLLFDTNGATLQQIAVLGVVHAKKSKVRAALRDARGFGSALVPGSKATIVAQEAGTTTIDWAISVPFIGLSGQMRMSEVGSDVCVDAIAGALRGGRWRFGVNALGKHETLVTGWASFSFSESTWFLEQMLTADAYLGHGMTAASELMMMRSLRSLASRR